MKHLYLALASALFLLAAQPFALAAEEHDRARRAYQAGQVVGLAEVRARVRSTFEGRMLDAELAERRSNPRIPWVYKVKMLTPRGNVITIQLTAKTMEVLNVRGRGVKAARKRR